MVVSASRLTEEMRNSYRYLREGFSEKYLALYVIMEIGVFVIIVNYTLSLSLSLSLPPSLSLLFLSLSLSFFFPLFSFSLSHSLSTSTDKKVSIRQKKNYVSSVSHCCFEASMTLLLYSFYLF